MSYEEEMRLRSQLRLVQAALRGVFTKPAAAATVGQASTSTFANPDHTH